jgi:hypothetical protein
LESPEVAGLHEAEARGVGDASLVDGSRQLGGAPAIRTRVEQELHDAIRHAVAGGRDRRAERVDGAAGNHDERGERLAVEAELRTIFEGGRDEEAVAEVERVGRADHGGVGTQRAEVVEGVGVEVEERLELTERPRAELDVGLIDHGALAAVLSRRSLADADIGEGAEQAVLSRRTSVELDRGRRRLAGAVVRVEATSAGITTGHAAVVEEGVLGLAVGVLVTDEAADLQADIRTRDHEAGEGTDRADADVIDRRGLLGRKVGGLDPGGRGEAGGRSEEKALDELHSDLLKELFPGSPISRSAGAVP